MDARARVHMRWLLLLAPCPLPGAVAIDLHRRAAVECTCLWQGVAEHAHAQARFRQGHRRALGGADVDAKDPRAGAHTERLLRFRADGASQMLWVVEAGDHS